MFTLPRKSKISRIIIKKQIDYVHIFDRIDSYRKHLDGTCSIGSEPKERYGIELWRIEPGYGCSPDSRLLGEVYFRILDYQAIRIFLENINRWSLML